MADANEAVKSDDAGLASIDALEPQKKQAREDAPKSKYSAKSRDDLEKMLDENQSMIGRQSQEVAKHRREIEDLRSADSFVKGQLNQAPAAQPNEDLDYFGDPAKAIKQSIEDHPLMKSTQNELQTMRAETAAREIEAKHPDAAQIIHDDAFKNYIATSPSRTLSYKSALTSMDIALWDELIGAYKATAQRNPEVEALKGQSRSESVRAASSGSASASSESMAGKKISREDIVKLQMSDKERYDRLYPEIVQAYREGRIV
jgi:hypothetical protein